MVLSVTMAQNVIVSDPQSSPVTVYDYYEPGTKHTVSSETFIHYCIILSFKAIV